MSFKLTFSFTLLQNNSYADIHGHFSSVYSPLFLHVYIYSSLHKHAKDTYTESTPAHQL